MVLTKETEKLEEKPITVLVDPPQIPHGMSWALDRASEMRSRSLTF
jgi:hypothetical protein